MPTFRNVYSYYLWQCTTQPSVPIIHTSASDFIFIPVIRTLCNNSPTWTISTLQFVTELSWHATTLQRHNFTDNIIKLIMNVKFTGNFSCLPLPYTCQSFTFLHLPFLVLDKVVLTIYLSWQFYSRYLDFPYLPFRATHNHYAISLRRLIDISQSYWQQPLA
jgi:hypothetical protein